MFPSNLISPTIPLILILPSCNTTPPIVETPVAFNTPAVITPVVVTSPLLKKSVTPILAVFVSTLAAEIVPVALILVIPVNAPALKMTSPILFLGLLA